MTATTECISCQRRGVGRLQDDMPGRIDQGLFGSGIIAPKQNNKTGSLPAQAPDHFIGEALPPDLTVRSGLAFLYREDRIEQKHALSRPVRQIPVSGRGNAQVAIQFLVNIPQGGRDGHSFWYGKAQAHRLPRSVIRVLAEDDDPDLREWGLIKGMKDEGTGREYGLAGRTCLLQKRFDLAEVGLGKRFS